ncbi:DUF1493 family protein [Flavobacterium undicola]|uniref:DUF1493 family protein n=1 Tax=Flavobacterium undicola TaxID=1932779 RepID=UPI00137787F7|nr:DUF1493 family protein [Flavobacterium undicola]MBA0884034.1 DUF1493 family protein [Flavobacterium undicola]
MKNITEILEFVKDLTGTKKVTKNSDIENDLGCSGDDFDELIEKYSEHFNVDMSTYLWYFHTKEEGFGSIGGFFFKPPNSQVERIAVTPKMLFKFAEKGKWDIKYPEHKIPKKRYDLLINQIILIVIVIYGIYYWLIK